MMRREKLRILYFGMLGTLSSKPLQALLQTRHEVLGIVLPRGRIPPFLLGKNRATFQLINSSKTPLNLLSTSTTTLEVVANSAIPLYAVDALKAEETQQAIKEMAPDVICVSCFSHLLPPQLLEIPILGCLNLHPSLLPHLRGSAPLFWTFKKGVRETGVTVHQMDEGFDTGNVLGQRPYSLPNGISMPEVEMELAQLGGKLLVEVLDQIANNTLESIPQPDGYQADLWPTDADFELDRNWPAERAFNFMRGTIGWKRPYFITLDNRKHYVKIAVAIEPNKKQNRPLIQEGDQIKIQFSDGVLICR